ncbi:MAG: CHAT domain-containing protein, partial [Cyclobacteriaceae bacterium]|nr:CHAT domain-containing protein [Cyclobacteriaceae bacterium]
VTAAGFRMEPFDLSDKASRLVTAMRNAIRFQIGTALTRHATELYSLLVPTVPSGIHSLILMPDGVFNTLPFEALINPNTGKYLIEDFSVSYDYSSSLYLDRINRTIPDIQRDILLMAPIHFDGTSLPSLPATAKEVREISRLFVSAHAQASPFINGQASEEWIKTQDLRTFRYIHLATHGVVNESSPEWSRIYLQPSPAEDGQLLSGDIYNLSVQADLIALSACETGLGKLEKGEGILGLSRALLYAGANNLLVSLWPVSDTSTSQLMIEFYRHHLFIQSPDSYGSSLRQAKLALLQSETFHAPYFWASFIIVGH